MAWPPLVGQPFGHKFKAIWTARQSLSVRDRQSSYPSRTTQGDATMKIVVIGGTGLIGSKVASNLRQKGHDIVAAAPSTGVNTITGEGLAEACAGTQVVIDVANAPDFA